MNKQKSGFTLIETVIYIALFSIVIFGGIVGSYNIIEGSNKNSEDIKIQKESLFINQKISWAITNASSILISNIGKTLTISRPDLNNESPIIITEAGSVITLSRGANPSSILNNNRYKVSDLIFKYDLLQKSVSVEYKINNRNFKYTKYLLN